MLGRSEHLELVNGKWRLDTVVRAETSLKISLISHRRNQNTTETINQSLGTYALVLSSWMLGHDIFIGTSRANLKVLPPFVEFHPAWHELSENDVHGYRGVNIAERNVRILRMLDRFSEAVVYGEVLDQSVRFYDAVHENSGPSDPYLYVDQGDGYLQEYKLTDIPRAD